MLIPGHSFGLTGRRYAAAGTGFGEGSPSDGVTPDAPGRTGRYPGRRSPAFFGPSVRPRIGRAARAATALVLVGVLLAFVLPTQAHAIVFVSNLEVGNTATDTEYSTPESGSVAQRFTAGRNEAGYTLTSVEIGYHDGEGDRFSAKLCTVRTVGTHFDQPTTDCTDLIAPTSFPSRDSRTALTFTAPSGTTLEKGTHYTVVLTPDTGKTVTYRTTTLDRQSTQEPGWGIAGEFRNKDGGTWRPDVESLAIKIQVNATVLNEAPTGAPTISGEPQVRASSKSGSSSARRSLRTRRSSRRRSSWRAARSRGPVAWTAERTCGISPSRRPARGT